MGKNLSFFFFLNKMSKKIWRMEGNWHKDIKEVQTESWQTEETLGKEEK